MEHRSYSYSHRLAFVFVNLTSIVLLLFSPRSVEAYKNYTVGDSLGWYDNLQKPNVNYQKWVAGKNFSLGDFLIFNTDNNHSVVQTYNFITYKHCDFNNAQDNDTTEWSAGDQSATAIGAVTVAVPLLKEAMTYFFSGFYDGEQCKHGQRFKVNVTHGQGLPESLKNPSNESPGPTSQESGGDDESAPETVVPSNFNNPHDDGSDSDVKEASRSVSLIEYSGFLDGKLNGVVILLWLISIV